MALSTPSLSVFPEKLELSFEFNPRHRLLLTVQSGDGSECDATAAAQFESSQPDIAAVDARGEVTALKAGTTTIRARFAGQQLQVPVTVSAPTTPGQIDFVNDILPVLSKAGCNAGKCHAKPAGQNGFKLSVFAHDPAADYFAITQDSRGRRVFPASPEESLLLRKPVLQVPHEGGERLTTSSPAYRLLVDWIRSGMPYTSDAAPKLDRLEVFPAERSYKKQSTQPLLVRAHFSNGAVRDVTSLTGFDSHDKEIAEADSSGTVRLGTWSGEAVIVARYMGMVAVSRCTVPSDERLPASAFDQLPRNNFIDELAYARFKKLGLFPAPTATDSEFVRRSTLDILGLLPSVEETRAFLANSDPDKRKKWVDHLLAHPAYADHWAGKWADLIRPNPQRVGVKSVYVLDQWLRASFRQNKSYREFAREILTAQGSTHQYGPAVLYRDRREPADVTTLISQVFLGVRLECAKCHHHPNEKWSQTDFYQLAAFFSSVKRKGTGISPPISGSPEFIYHAPGGSLSHPVTRVALSPKAPDGPLFASGENVDPRSRLVDWLAAPDNPFFARAAVNRVWAELMGRGLVDPVDDFRSSNPPTNEPLLNALAAHFIQHDYDLKDLMRTILSSHVYQLSCAARPSQAVDTQNFSHAYRRRLPAEALLDSVNQVTASTESLQGLRPAARAAEVWNYQIDSDFLDAFGRPNSSSDCPCEHDSRPTLVQALHLMNSTALQSKISADSGRARQLAASSTPPEAIIEELYLAAYCRFPTPEEQAIAAGAFTAPGVTRQNATEDILWALLNSAEFVFNH